jgi:hypothetical protein
MKNKLRLVIYSDGKLDYRYVLHGSNPTVRRHVHIAEPTTVDDALKAQIKAALPASRLLESAVSHLKIVHSR